MVSLHRDNQYNLFPNFPFVFPRPSTTPSSLVPRRTRFFLFAQFEVLRPLDAQLLLGLALLALEAQRNLLGGLGLLVEHRLGLAAETHLLLVVSPLPLGEVGRLARLVLRHLVIRVLTALLALAKGFPLLGHVHHLDDSLLTSVSELSEGKKGESGERFG